MVFINISCFMQSSNQQESWPKRNVFNLKFHEIKKKSCIFNSNLRNFLLKNTAFLSIINKRRYSKLAHCSIISSWKVCKLQNSWTVKRICQTLSHLICLKNEMAVAQSYYNFNQNLTSKCTNIKSLLIIFPQFSNRLTLSEQFNWSFVNAYLCFIE